MTSSSSSSGEKRASYCTQCGERIGSVRACPACGEIHYFRDLPDPPTVWGTPEDSRIIDLMGSRPAATPELAAEASPASPPPPPEAEEPPAASPALPPAAVPGEPDPETAPVEEEAPLVGNDSIFDFLSSEPAAPAPRAPAPPREPAPPTPPTPPTAGAPAPQSPPRETPDPLPEGAGSTFTFLPPAGTRDEDDIPDPLAPAEPPSAVAPSKAPPDFGGTFFMDDLGEATEPAPPAEPPPPAPEVEVPPAVLVRGQPPDSGRIHELAAGENHIGTLVESDVHLLKQDHKGVSRRHAMVRITRGPEGPWEATVQDMGSLNGTFVNDERITAAVPLRSGDELRLANHRFVFEMKNSS